MADDPGAFEDQLEVLIAKEYSDLARIFTYLVTTQERTYLCNKVRVTPVSETGGQFFRAELEDAWVWDLYLPTRFLESVEVLTFADIHVEELKQEMSIG